MNEINVNKGYLSFSYLPTDRYPIIAIFRCFGGMLYDDF